MYGVAFLMVLFPYLLWRGTWFGKPLTDGEIEKALQDGSRPRKIQHALVQIAERISRGETSSVRRWYPEVERLSTTSPPEVRAMATWLMGQDNQFESFHQRLADLVQDPDLLVRRNAALALVRFGDSRGKPELVAMLRAHKLTAPQDGLLSFRLKDGEAVTPGTLIAQIQIASEGNVDIRSPLPGFFSNPQAGGKRPVASSETVGLISPAESQVWEALRALFLVGQTEELADVEPYAGDLPQMSERVRQQALQTVGAIRGRGSR